MKLVNERNKKLECENLNLQQKLASKEEELSKIKHQMSEVSKKLVRYKLNVPVKSVLSSAKSISSLEINPDPINKFNTQF